MDMENNSRRERDTLELSAIWEDEIVFSENYDDISENVRRVGEWNTETVYEIANETMQKYYEAVFDAMTVQDLFCSCYLKCIAQKEYSDVYGQTKLEVLAKSMSIFPGRMREKVCHRMRRKAAGLWRTVGFPGRGRPITIPITIMPVKRCRKVSACSAMRSVMNGACRDLILSKSRQRAGFVRWEEWSSTGCSSGRR